MVQHFTQSLASCVEHLFFICYKTTSTTFHVNEKVHQSACLPGVTDEI